MPKRHLAELVKDGPVVCATSIGSVGDFERVLLQIRPADPVVLTDLGAPHP